MLHDFFMYRKQLNFKP